MIFPRVNLGLNAMRDLSTTDYTVNNTPQIWSAMPPNTSNEKYMHYFHVLSPIT